MKEDLPTIAILGTGGTIAGKAGSASATTGYVPGSATVEDLLASVPGLEDIANLTSVQVSNIGSEDMTDEIWARLVKETESQLRIRKSPVLLLRTVRILWKKQLSCSIKY